MRWQLEWMVVLGLFGCSSTGNDGSGASALSSGGASSDGSNSSATSNPADGNAANSANDDTSGSSSSSDGESAASTSGNSSGGVPFGDDRSGEATYYAADGSGACSFDASPDDLDVAALNAPDWEGSGYCGACAAVDGPNGSVTVRIVDLCPECASGDLDLSPQAFEKIAAIAQGRVPISWSFVSCDVEGPVRYRYKDGTNQWWTAVQVQNHKLPIVSLEWSSDGQSFLATQREDYNYFLDAAGFGDNPVTVRITAVDGQVLTDELPAPEELLVVDGQAQFD